MQVTNLKVIESSDAKMYKTIQPSNHTQCPDDDDYEDEYGDDDEDDDDDDVDDEDEDGDHDVDDDDDVEGKNINQKMTLRN